MAAIRKSLITFDRLLIIGLIIVVLGQAGLPSYLARAQGGGEIGPQAALPESFTYQGRFEEDGVPVTGAYDFEFALYDAGTGGTALSTLPPLSSVPVTNGLFTVQLAFPAGQIQGEQRWLNVRVRPNASTAFSQLARQELTATPYALYAKSVAMAGTGSATTAARSDHNHYGSVWTGDTYPTALTVDNETTNGTGIAAEGELVGLYGNSLGSGFSAVGVQGTSESGIGVRGEATGGDGVVGIGSTGVSGTSTGSGSGVRGTSSGSTSSGVLGSGGRFGVSGESNLKGGSGVIGRASVSILCQGLGASFPEEYCYGVTGVATDVPNGGGVGVKGIGNNTGVWAQGGAIGIYASGTQDAGYFQGDLTVTGTFPTPSDARLKRDIADLTYGLEDILALKPKSYSYIEGDGTTRIGLIAQDVQQILPELVGVDALNNDMLTMNYIDLIPVLVRAIQEQQAQIDALTAGD